MGSAPSSSAHEFEAEEDDAEDEEDDEGPPNPNPSLSYDAAIAQEPELLLHRTSATPLSPQSSASAAASSRLLGPAVRVWDPCNLLLRPPPPPDAAAEVLLVAHGEYGDGAPCADLVGGRLPGAELTAAGRRQARALAVLLDSRGVRFSAVCSSPLNRARATATLVCQAVGFPEEQIQYSDALTEMSHGHWEGLPHSQVYTPETLYLIGRTEPDFSAPSGESLRQVEFRMIEFLNRTVLGLPKRIKQGDLLMHQDKKFSGKSRLQFMSIGEKEAKEDHFSGEFDYETRTQNSKNYVGIFTHATPIKCLVAGLLNCSLKMHDKICIDDSSVTVLQHSIRAGWRIKRLNDTSHLSLL
ncbi:2,3-bisphosphoglycerate-dependent phosphoglycerate mutase [Ananas comosus]|uniref:2,3-bisphosphoglycerate-dependent phosphoglycerate mutase n=1 Tax=Ananas comosus TaxID=4615 RepID=A0A199VT85_ANACO|nr:2,3-bisphosphoglycerate-dependent phosphoglycerate mutase [Ananas comosus]